MNARDRLNRVRSQLLAQERLNRELSHNLKHRENIIEARARAKAFDTAITILEIELGLIDD